MNAPFGYHLNQDSQGDFKVFKHGAIWQRCALPFLILPGAALAHHSLLTYDVDEIVEIEGEVTNVFWRNPHVQLTVRAVDDDGGERVWTVEGSPVNSMERAGIDQAVVSVGDYVSLAGHPSGLAEDELRLVLLTPAGGQTVLIDADSAAALGLVSEDSLAVRTGEATAAISADDLDVDGIFRVWTNRDRHWMQDVRGWWAKSHPLTESAQASLDAWDPVTDDPAKQCIPAGMPEAMLMPFPIEFVDQGDIMVLNIEEWDNSRTIHLNADPDAEAPPSRLGYSVGRWEDDTLIVETSRIDYPYFNDQGIPQSEALAMVERFTLSENGTKLDWTATVTDPETFTEPIIMPEFHWDWIPGQEIKPYNCVVAE